MKRIPFVAMVVLLASFIPLQAQMSQSDPGYKSATVVSLTKHMMPADFIGGVISDVIPQPQKYVYDVGIRLGCNLYVARYESETNQMPAMFNLNHTVNVRLDGDLMTLSSPQGGQTVTTVIVSDEQLSNCPANE